jgi:hypothetical protein
MFRQVNRRTVIVVSVVAAVAILIGLVSGLVVQSGMGRAFARPGSRTAARPAAQIGPKAVDHTTISLFYQLAADDVELARLRSWLVMYGDKSVGDNIRTGLTCLAGTGPDSCDAAVETLGLTGLVGPRFSMANIRYAMMDEAGCGGWNELWQCFQNEVAAQPGDYAALSWGHSYMEVEQPDVLRYFNDLGAPGNVVAYEGYQDDRGVPRWYWTSSLNNGSNVAAAEYNNLMRARAVWSGGVLLDLADLEAYDLDGDACTSLFGFTPGLCYPAYTSNPASGNGHLTKLGQVRGAMAVWLALAFLDGWSGAPEPPPEPSATATSFLQSPLATPTPDCDCDPCPCGTVTVTPTVVPATATATATPRPTAAPTVTPTVVPTAVPTVAPTATAGGVQCVMAADMAAFTADLYETVLNYPYQNWSAIVNGGSITQMKVRAQKTACEAQAQR